MRDVQRSIFLITLLLVAVGVVMIYSASSIYAYSSMGDSLFFLKRHLLYLALGFAMMLFAMASLGLPGLGNFVGEFLVLQGSYAVSVTFTALAAVGLLAATVYAVWMVQRTFHGPPVTPSPADLGKRETATLAAMVAVIVWLVASRIDVETRARPARGPR